MRIITFFLIFFGCNHATNWQVDHLYSDCKEHCSNKLLYLSKDCISGIDLEIIYTGNTIKGYLNLYPHVIKQKSTMLKLITKESSEQFTAYCLKGGQKILLPQEALNFFLYALENNQGVQIAIGGYESLIEPLGFTKSFKKLQTFPKLINPFEFSFL